jgi:hypothetical protein
MQRTSLLIATGFLLAFGSTQAAADGINVTSDTLSVKDAAGLFTGGGSLTEHDEDIGIDSITVPVNLVIPLGPNENFAGSSDFLSISFTVELISDENITSTLPDSPELASASLQVSASSDTTDCPSIYSDCLNVIGWDGKKYTANLPEGAEPGSTSVDVPGFEKFLAPFENGNGLDDESDIFSVTGAHIELFSDADQSGPDVGESFSDTITVGAVSDVPEPSTVVLLASAATLLSGLLRKRKQ